MITSYVVLLKIKQLPSFLLPLAIVISLLSRCSSEKNVETNSESFCAPQTLSETQFSSAFFHYVNYYSFETDSSGFSENGQLVWSIGLDPEKYADAMDSVFYEVPAPFRYSISDSVLTIEYTNPDHPKTDQFRIFHYNCDEKQWIGIHEYAYGREYLNEVTSRVDVQHRE